MRSLRAVGPEFADSCRVEGPGYRCSVQFSLLNRPFLRFLRMTIHGSGLKRMQVKSAGIMSKRSDFGGSEAFLLARQNDAHAPQLPTESGRNHGHITFPRRRFASERASRRVESLKYVQNHP